MVGSRFSSSKIVLTHGKIHDEAKKFYGPILVLDYGMSERKLKVEISNRNFSDRYEIKNLMGQSMKVMVQEDLLAHKLLTWVGDLLDQNMKNFVRNKLKDEVLEFLTFVKEIS